MEKIRSEQSNKLPDWLEEAAKMTGKMGIEPRIRRPSHTTRLPNTGNTEGLHQTVYTTQATKRKGQSKIAQLYLRRKEASANKKMDNAAYQNPFRCVDDSNYYYSSYNSSSSGEWIFEGFVIGFVIVLGIIALMAIAAEILLWAIIIFALILAAASKR